MIALSMVSMRSAPETDARSFKAIARFCGLGLIASFCMVTLGLDLSAGWL